MWITPGRILYSGLLGRPSTRRLGGWVVYFTNGEPFELSIAAPAEDEPVAQGLLGIVPPYVPHRVASASRELCSLILEPERIDLTAAPAPLAELLRSGMAVYGGETPQAAALLEQLQDACNQLASIERSLPADDAAFDRRIFGSPMQQPIFDEHVHRSLAHIEAGVLANLGSGQARSGAQLAAEAGLSLPRFIQRFSGQIGVPLRTLRSWKRARSVLPRLAQQGSLTEIALDAGYPDSAHFSRSMRRVFGLQPRQIMVGSLHLALLAASPNVRGASRGQQ